MVIMTAAKPFTRMTGHRRMHAAVDDGRDALALVAFPDADSVVAADATDDCPA